VIEFHLDGRSGVAPYMQLIQQVRRAMRLGLLTEGDQLPTVKDVVAKVAINPNTVLKAYRELEYEQLVEGRHGLGTYVVGSLAGPPPGTIDGLRKRLESWVDQAGAAGLSPEHIRAVVDTTLHRLLGVKDSA
jgi:GntR family transcriptional regulator